MGKGNKFSLYRIVVAIFAFGSISPINSHKIEKAGIIDGSYVTIDGIKYMMSLTEPIMSVVYDKQYEEMENVVIPPTNTIGDKVYTVIAIDDWAFYGCKNLVSVTIPGTLNYLGKSVFSNCTALQSAFLSTGLEKISYAMFSGCESLERIDIPESVKEIGTIAFQGCVKLKNIKLPEGLDSIREGAFASCEWLKSINIPSSVRYIGGNPLVGCKNLTDIKVDEGNPWYGSENGVLYTKDNKTLISYPSFNGYNEIPSGFSTIGKFAFEECIIKSPVTIPEGVEIIEYRAFESCTDLETVTFPSTLIEIQSGVFNHCKNFSIAIFNSPTPPKMDKSGFGYYNMEDKNHTEKLVEPLIFVPDGSVERYEEAGWKKVHPLSELAGVEELPISEDRVSTVYTIDGKMVMQTADEALLQSLPKGLYIINGKKVAIGCW